VCAHRRRADVQLYRDTLRSQSARQIGRSAD
jgi:hypothetical protein